MHIQSIKINNLFHTFNVDLSTKKTSSVIMGYGLNGVGKSTMFRLINWIFAFEWERVFSVDFDEILIKGSRNNSSFDFHVKIESSNDDQPKIFFQLDMDDNKYQTQIIYLMNEDGRFFRQRTWRFINNDAAEENWFVASPQYSKLRILFQNSETSHSFRQTLMNFIMSTKDSTKREDFLNILDFIVSTNVHFIEDNRLNIIERKIANTDEPGDIRRDRHRAKKNRHLNISEMESNISEMENDLRKRIQQSSREFQRTKDRLASTFLERVLSGGHLAEDIQKVMQASWEDFVSRYSEVYPEIEGIIADRLDLDLGKEDNITQRVYTLANKYVDQLNQIGLTSYEKMNPNFQNWLGTRNKHLPALLIFQTSLDLLAALAPFMKEGFLRRSLEFVAMLQQKFSDRTKLLFKPDGIVIEIPSTKTSIPIQMLSSGQKHMLTLLYHFHWRTSEGSIIFIDEPEISLNIEWQRQLAQDLLNIAEKRNIQFILATHSPYIFHKYYETHGTEFVVTESSI